MSLGLERAGFESIYVNEINDHAMRTYVANSPVDSPVRQKANRSNDIFELTSDPAALRSFGQVIRERADGDVAIVAGGPPCQGFSGIGHRRTFKLDKTDIPSNHLYAEMAKVVQAVAPKVFIFENVQGLLHSRWTPSGEKGEIWEDVQKAFRDVVVNRSGHELAYLITHELVHAKEFGVPQNRPRVIMVGVRRDIADAAGYGGVWLPSADPGYLAPKPPDPVDLLSDLVDPDWWPGGATVEYLHPARTPAQHVLRTLRDHSLMRKGRPLHEQEYSRHSDVVRSRFQAIRTLGYLPVEMRTKKFNQRLVPERWNEAGPNMTVASMPDDFVHFAQDRSFTVREWARFQGFPDWYQFHGPRTTGGRRRAGDPKAGQWKRDLPKYTQIGNAVPVALAEGIGRRLDGLLGLRS
jgi:DNA (cytosine-5)-methyltransferase 1